ncbi:RNA polymerase sigma factor [Rubrolithibacter danxiaensis]|uniref:RNA polymerase sigma factor n=1 Tax=Rubrolithibacter danxiaensis TaxID=3390805 RepID=UPI003BF88709
MAEILIQEQSAKLRESKLVELYTSIFPDIARFISRKGGTLEQAKDIFHDAIIIWYEKQQVIEQLITQTERQYIFGIAKHLWYRNFSKESQIISLDAVQHSVIEAAVREQLSINKLLNLLERSGKKCLDLLKSFYYDKLSMAELAQRFGYRSVRSATVQKYKCLEKIRETVKEKSICYEDFLE